MYLFTLRQANSNLKSKTCSPFFLAGFISSFGLFAAKRRHAKRQKKKKKKKKKKQGTPIAPTSHCINSLVLAIYAVFLFVYCWNYRTIVTFKYSWLSLSRPRLSRITAYLEVKIWSLPIHENLTTDGKYCRKEEKLLLRSNFSSFPQYFQYISNFKSPVTYQFVKCG